MHRSETEISDMVWAASFIQQHVPVSPADGAVVEIIDHRAAILFAKLPFPNPARIESVDACFGEEKVLVGKISCTNLTLSNIGSAPLLG
jgi:hypothetical protein